MSAPDSIARLYAEIGQPDLPEDAPQDQLIVLSYRLHNLYNAFENILRNVAAVFENHVDHVDEAAGWHTQLLRHMRLDLTPVRPALIDESAYEKLDELRRFRHLFRSTYGVQLDPERLRRAPQSGSIASDLLAADRKFPGIRARRAARTLSLQFMRQDH